MPRGWAAIILRSGDARIRFGPIAEWNCAESVSRDFQDVGFTEKIYKIIYHTITPTYEWHERD